MTAATDMPGVQLYTGNFIEEPKGKRPYHPRDGVCLETQFFPNAMAVATFQKPILRAGGVYDHRTVYAFSV
jgi:aldose 1-epimerase